MNNTSLNDNDFFEDNLFDLKEQFFRYLFFWRYFLLSITFFIAIAFLFNRYTHEVYDTNAKIQILDKKQNNLEMPTAENLFSNSKINLENEIEVLKSSSILNEVIKNLKLNVYVEAVGDIMTARIIDYPFALEPKIVGDSIFSFSSFDVSLNDNGLTIYDIFKDKEYFFNDYTTLSTKHDLPFEIFNINKDHWLSKSYKINFIDTYNLINNLKQNILISPLGKSSDIINLNFKNSNSEFSRIVLNELIDVFNNDGVRDRQLIHKRTIDFVNDRYKYIASELELIELEKQSYKTSNELIDLITNSSISLSKSSESEETLFSNENQIFLVTNLLNDLQIKAFELLPSNIGIDNIKINTLILSYNDLVLDKQKLHTSAGPNNPYLRQINDLLLD